MSHWEVGTGALLNLCRAASPLLPADWSATMTRSERPTCSF